MIVSFMAAFLRSIFIRNELHSTDRAIPSFVGADAWVHWAVIAQWLRENRSLPWFRTKPSAIAETDEHTEAYKSEKTNKLEEFHNVGTNATPVISSSRAKAKYKFCNSS